MKNKGSIRLYHCVLVLFGTIFLAFLFLLISSSLKGKKFKYNFPRTSIPQSFILKSPLPFALPNLDGFVIYGNNSSLVFRKTPSPYKGLDSCVVINDKGEFIQTSLIPEEIGDVIGYLEGKIFGLSRYKIKYKECDSNKNLIQTLWCEDNIINATLLKDYEFLTLGVDSNKYRNEVSFSIWKKEKDSLHLMKTYKEVLLTGKYKVLPEMTMAYSGTFLKANNYITYSFEHIPYVYVFDGKGCLLKTIKTKDNVPFPSIINYKEMFIYERGKVFNSNISSFVYKNNVYVFSYHTDLTNGYLVDCYSLINGDYQGSFSIDNGIGLQNRDIDNVISYSQRILLFAGKNIITFKCRK